MDTNTYQIACLGTTCIIHEGIAKGMRKTYVVAPWHDKEGERGVTSSIRPPVLALAEEMAGVKEDVM